MDTSILLTELCGRRVLGPDGRMAGTVHDAAVRLDAPHPRVRSLRLRRGRCDAGVLYPAQVADLVAPELRARAAPVPAGDDAGELLLRRDVLDAQVYDLEGRRLARVADVVLVTGGDGLRVAGVDVGPRAVARRLGLGRVLGGGREDPVDWASLHLASRHGHALEIDAPGDRLTRLGPAALAGLVAELPTARGAAVLGAVDPAFAAEAVGRQRPSHGGRLLDEIGGEPAARLVERMPRDDAAAALRHVAPETRAAVLGTVPAAHADSLRRLLDQPATQAGGIMNPDVVTVPAGAGIDAMRAAVAAAAPGLDALATVFVVDADGRPLGAVPPRALVLGDARPRPVHPVAMDAPLGAVADVFARHDQIAAPVVDGERRLVGAVAVDDLLEELLHARIPRRRRFRRRPGTRVRP